MFSARAPLRVCGAACITENGGGRCAAGRTSQTARHPLQVDTPAHTAGLQKIPQPCKPHWPDQRRERQLQRRTLAGAARSAHGRRPETAQHPYGARHGRRAVPGLENSAGAAHLRLVQQQHADMADTGMQVRSQRVRGPCSGRQPRLAGRVARAAAGDAAPLAARPRRWGPKLASHPYKDTYRIYLSEQVQRSLHGGLRLWARGRVRWQAQRRSCMPAPPARGCPAPRQRGPWIVATPAPHLTARRCLRRPASWHRHAADPPPSATPLPLPPSPDHPVQRLTSRPRSPPS